MIFPASTNADGQCMAFPNPCKLQAGPAVVVTPFPSIGELKDANPGTLGKKVLILNKPTVIETTEIPMSKGDEAGALGGVVSGVNMGPVTFKSSSTKVKFEGVGAVSLTAVAAQNGSNANAPMGTQVSPSQAKVLISP